MDYYSELGVKSTINCQNLADILKSHQNFDCIYVVNDSMSFILCIQKYYGIQIIGKMLLHPFKSDRDNLYSLIYGTVTELMNETYNSSNIIKNYTNEYSHQLHMKQKRKQFNELGVNPNKTEATE